MASVGVFAGSIVVDYYAGVEEGTSKCPENGGEFAGWEEIVDVYCYGGSSGC